MRLLIAITIIVLIVAVIIFRNIRVKKRVSLSKARPNRYYKQRYHYEPTIKNKALAFPNIKQELEKSSPTDNAKVATVENDVIEDADVVLGLKEPQSDRNIKAQEQAPVSVQEDNISKPQYIILYVMAPKDQAYRGYELLQSLLAVGLRYGEMNIFHRHAEKSGRGPILFSLASAAEPGIFELPKMGGFSCPGLTLFFSLNKSENPLDILELMMETANQLAEDLGGTVLDEHQQLLNGNNIVQLRKKLRQIIENKQTLDLFA